jgi:hypothetical protein
MKGDITAKHPCGPIRLVFVTQCSNTGGRGALLPLAIEKDQTMKILDMSHVMNVHTPGWVGYAGNKIYYAQNLQTQMIVAQRIDTAVCTENLIRID